MTIGIVNILHFGFFVGNLIFDIGNFFKIMMSFDIKKTAPVLLFAFIFAVSVISPFAVFAQTTAPTPAQCAQKWQVGCSVIPCGTITDSTGKVSNPCGFNDIVILVSNIVQFLIYAGMVISGLVFIYVGWLYLSSGGDESKVKQAKEIVWKVVWGFLAMCGAWLIVKTISSAFIGDAGLKTIFDNIFK